MTVQDPLLERLVRVGKVAGQDALAKLAYEMSRRCLAAASNPTASHTRWIKDPRSVGALYSDLLVLEARTGLTLDKGELPLADPTRESAIAHANACLDLGVRIEGDSPRVRFLRAQCVLADGGTEEAADRLAAMVQGSLTKSWYQVAQESRQTALLSLGRYDQVASIGQALLIRDSRRPDAAFNRLTAQAWMESESEYRESAIRFRLALDGVPDPGYWSRLVAEEAPWLAARFRRDPDEIMESLQLVGSPPSSQRPGQ